MEEKEEAGNGMRLSGWIFLLLSWAFILILTAFCFYKVFAKKKVD